MLTRLREGTPGAAEERRADPGSAAGAPIRIEALTHSFGELRALERIDLEAEPGEVVGIVGPSGCGKTTLLELVAGLREATSGKIVVGGRAEPSQRLESCAYMPQRDLLLPWLSALDNAALALRIAGTPRDQARRSAGEHFGRLGLSGFEGSRPGELSGGMRQRVAFLRTLMAGRPVLLLDEPFASLDAITRAEMQSWLAAALGPDRHTVLLVTHDVEEAAVLGDRVAVLSPRPGRVVAELEVGAPRPRSATDDAVVEARRRALEALR